MKVRYDNNAAENGIQIHGDIAITMGNVYLTNAKGEEVMVDKTFVFRKCKDGKLRLVRPQVGPAVRSGQIRAMKKKGLCCNRTGSVRGAGGSPARSEACRRAACTTVEARFSTEQRKDCRK